VKGEVEKAKQVFKDKAEPQSRAEDYLYKPTDLELRVRKLKDIVSSVLLTPDFVRGNVRTAVVDYIGCYFPESLRMKFDVQIFEELILSQKWEGIEDYMLEFRANVQGDIVHSHPGLFLFSP
jgi:hypothetical protein